jgi:hypothetical protein
VVTSNNTTFISNYVTISHLVQNLIREETNACAIWPSRKLSSSDFRILQTFRLLQIASELRLQISSDFIRILQTSSAFKLLQASDFTLFRLFRFLQTFSYFRILQSSEFFRLLQISEFSLLQTLSDFFRFLAFSDFIFLQNSSDFRLPQTWDFRFHQNSSGFSDFFRIQEGRQATSWQSGNRNTFCAPSFSEILSI